MIKFIRLPSAPSRQTGMTCLAFASRINEPPAVTDERSVRRGIRRQSKHLADLLWRSDFPVLLVCDAYHAFDRLGVIGVFLAPTVVEIIFKADTNMSAHDYSKCRERQLILADS